MLLDICIHVYTCLSICICVYIYIYICVYAHIYIYTHISGLLARHVEAAQGAAMALQVERLLRSDINN